MTTLTHDAPTPLAFPTPTRRASWIGRTLSGLAIAFLLMDLTMKLLQV